MDFDFVVEQISQTDYEKVICSYYGDSLPRGIHKQLYANEIPVKITSIKEDIKEDIKALKNNNNEFHYGIVTTGHDNPKIYSAIRILLKPTITVTQNFEDPFFDDIYDYRNRRNKIKMTTLKDKSRHSAQLSLGRKGLNNDSISHVLGFAGLKKTSLGGKKTKSRRLGRKHKRSSTRRYRK